jgi:hypothetical protein
MTRSFKKTTPPKPPPKANARGAASATPVSAARLPGYHCVAAQVLAVLAEHYSGRGRTR